MLRSSTLLKALSPLILLAGCAPSQYGGVSGTRFNLCAPVVVTPDPTATADQVADVGQALALWNQRAGAHLALPGDPAAGADAPALPLHFQNAAGNFYGLYDGQSVQVFINASLTGHPLVVTIAHELGHSYGLVHVPPDQRASVMNPGNLTVEPTSDDVAALDAIWGTCGPDGAQ